MKIFHNKSNNYCESEMDKEEPDEQEEKKEPVEGTLT